MSRDTVCQITYVYHTGHNDVITTYCFVGVVHSKERVYRPESTPVHQIRL